MGSNPPIAGPSGHAEFTRRKSIVQKRFQNLIYLARYKRHDLNTLCFDKIRQRHGDSTADQNIHLKIKERFNLA